jgi:hypothetical protein
LILAIGITFEIFPRAWEGGSSEDSIKNVGSTSKDRRKNKFGKFEGDFIEANGHRFFS